MVEIKVKDNRMFDQRGELREEFRHLEDAVAEAVSDAAPPLTTEPPQAAEPPEVSEPEHVAESRLFPEHNLEPPSLGGAADPLFLDLLAMLAEPATVFLGDAVLPDGRIAQDLERARLYIDLLDVVRQKTAGNLNSEERSVLEDVLYRLRLRYVEKQGRA